MLVRREKTRQNKNLDAHPISQNRIAFSAETPAIQRFLADLLFPFTFAASVAINGVLVMQPAALARSLLARFSNPTLLLCVAVVLGLPNALSIGALLFGIGAPPRTTAIVAYATVTLIARMVSRLLIVVLFLAVAVYDAIATVALLFNLAPSEVGLALYLGGRTEPFASPLYVGLCFALSVFLSGPTSRADAQTRHPSSAAAPRC